ncbi:MAG: hypothetical protein SXA11_10235 [Cyanobacteriota bacterium]|nr:hypothetical protein [Cyanobacteriota bacterium]
MREPSFRRMSVGLYLYSGIIIEWVHPWEQKCLSVKGSKIYRKQ